MLGYGLKNRGMLLVSGNAAAGQNECRMFQKTQCVDDRIQRLKQVPVVRRPVERIVKSVVDVHQARWVLQGVGFLGKDILQLLDFCRVGLTGGESRGGSFKGFSNSVEFAHLSLVGLRYEGTIPWSKDEQSLGNQSTDCLPHRCAAQFKPSGHIHFPKMLTRSDLSASKRSPDCPIGVFAARPRPIDWWALGKRRLASSLALRRAAPAFGS